MKEKMEWYGNYEPEDGDDKILVMPKYQSIAGYTLGVIVMDTWFPLIPGGCQNASSYPFPVLMKKVKELNAQRQLVRSEEGDKLMLEQLIEAAKELQEAGVRAITGCCGFFGRFQYDLAENLTIPCFMSSLLQVPMVMASIKANQKVGIMVADKKQFPFEMLDYLGINTKRVIIIGMEDTEEFYCVCENRGEWDNDKVRADMVRKAKELVQMDIVGSIVMECGDMPSYAVDVQHAVNMPVYDYMTMTKWIHSAICQKPYYGQV